MAGNSKGEKPQAAYARLTPVSAQATSCGFHAKGKAASRSTNMIHIYNQQIETKRVDGKPKH